MAKKSRPPQKQSTTPAERRGNYATRQEAARNRVLDELNERLRDRPPPTRGDLRAYSKYLLDRPHLFEGRYAPYIFLIIKAWSKENPPPKRLRQAQHIADLVNWVCETENIRPSEAYRKIAKAFNMSVDAVKKDHFRSDKTKRVKPR
jgi:hypothetical protein